MMRPKAIKWHRTSFAPGTAPLAMVAPIMGYQCGAFSVHGSGKRWYVSHVPTGRRASGNTPFKSKKAAQHAVLTVLPLLDWNMPWDRLEETIVKRGRQAYEVLTQQQGAAS